MNDRHGTFEAVMKILGTMGPEQDDLIFVISQPLIETYYVSIRYVVNSMCIFVLTPSFICLHLERYSKALH